MGRVWELELGGGGRVRECVCERERERGREKSKGIVVYHCDCCQFYFVMLIDEFTVILILKLV